MGYKVILTPQSVADLEAIVTFIAKDNPEQARTFGYELIDVALSLDTLPERGHITPEINEASVREIRHGAYRVIYEILQTPRGVSVLRFWHDARAGLRN